MQSFSSYVLVSVQAFFNHMKADIMRSVEYEMAAQEPFFKAWYEDTYLVRKFSMPLIYVCFLVPLRLVFVLPHPFFAGAALNMLPLYWSTLPYFPWYGNVYCFCLYGALTEAVVFVWLYFYVPGGKDMLESLLYGDANLRIFMGNPGKAQLTAGQAIGGVVLTFLGLKGWQVFDAYANEYIGMVNSRAAVSAAEGAVQIGVQKIEMTAQNIKIYNQATEAGIGTIKGLQDLGIHVSPEYAERIMQETLRDIAGNNVFDVKGDFHSGGSHIHDTVKVNDTSSLTGPVNVDATATHTYRENGVQK